ncbi:MAG: hypothetical protein H7Y36_08745 [Armatimonadetes bacterium]|nr:hypothetical protein [Akkermansiaceae bacterium]
MTPIFMDIIRSAIDHVTFMALLILMDGGEVGIIARHLTGFAVTIFPVTMIATINTGTWAGSGRETFGSINRIGMSARDILIAAKTKEIVDPASGINPNWIINRDLLIRDDAEA